MTVKKSYSVTVSWVDMVIGKFQYLLKSVLLEPEVGTLWTDCAATKQRPIYVSL